MRERKTSTDAGDADDEDDDSHAEEYKLLVMKKKHFMANKKKREEEKHRMTDVSTCFLCFIIFITTGWSLS